MFIKNLEHESLLMMNSTRKALSWHRMHELILHFLYSRFPVCRHQKTSFAFIQLILLWLILITLRKLITDDTW